VETHPIQQQVPHWCQFLAKKNIPFVHSLHSTHHWREALQETVLQMDPKPDVPLPAIMQIHSRIDAFERWVCDGYWNLTRSVLAEKDQKITELHDDRLNLIGKMAASMAHELRNPLTAIGGFLKPLRSNLPPEALTKVGKYIDVIQNEFENFQMQITGFLSFSKKRIIDEPFVIITTRQLVDSVLSMIRPRLVSENIHLEISPECDISLLVQKVAMQQVLSNLLNNGIDALSTTPSPKRIRIRCYEDEAAYYLSVTNNGPEIPEDVKETIFTPFVTSKMDGTGLGLTICKQIMAKNNGDITFTSDAKETNFILSFDKSAQRPPIPVAQHSQ
jgi:signal transduction histidine kinase